MASYLSSGSLSRATGSTNMNSQSRLGHALEEKSNNWATPRIKVASSNLFFSASKLQICGEFGDNQSQLLYCATSLCCSVLRSVYHPVHVQLCFSSCFRIHAPFFPVQLIL